MKHFNEYSAVSFAEPYVKKTADFLGDAKERAKFKYCQEKKKTEHYQQCVCISGVCPFVYSGGSYDGFLF